MLALLNILGGVALLLFGVRYMRKGLDRLFGPRLGTWMSRLGDTPRWAFLTGVGTAVVSPSSTTISLLAVQTVQAGQMTARQMLVVILGANIGLTVIVQLIAVKVDSLAPIAILFGVILFQFTRRSRSRGVGQVLLSLGFIFLGMTVIRGAVAGARLEQSEDFATLVQLVVDYPIVVALVAAVLTMVLQSSTATIGLIIGFGSAGAVGLAVAIPVVLGANVGMAATTLIIGFARVETRRLALCNLLLKAFVAVPGLILLRLIPLPALSPTAMAVWSAQVHTIFSIVVAAIGLPLVGPLTDFTARLVRARPSEQRETFGPRYIDRGPLGGMSLGLAQATREIMHISEIIRSMYDDVWVALKTNDEALAREVSERDDRVDRLDVEIKRFLTRLVKEESDETDAGQIMRLLRYLSELETIGDIIDKNLSELVLKRIRLGARFSEEGMKELDDFHGRIGENLLIGENAFATDDRRLAEQLLRHKERIDRYENELRDRHFARLTEGEPSSMETSAIHLDLLTHLRRINSCVTHVAHSVLQSVGSEPAPPPA